MNSVSALLRRRPTGGRHAHAAAVACMALALCFCNPLVDYPSLRDTEKRMFVTAEDLAMYGIASSKNLKTAKVKRYQVPGLIQVPCGFTEYSYECEDRVRDGNDLFYIYNVIIKTNPCPYFNPALFHDIGVKIGLKMAGKKLVPMKNHERNAQGAEAFVIMEGDRPVGTLARFNRNGVHYFLVIFGLYFDDYRQFEPLLENKTVAIRALFKS